MSNARRWTLLSLLLLSGCLSPSRRTSDVECRVLDVGFPPVHGQYAAPADPAAPVALYEVYLVNTGVTSRAFTEVTLDGRRLTQTASALLGPQNIAIDGHAVRLLDAPGDIGGRRRAKELHLSADPDVLMIPVDAVCDDLREGRSGASAWAVVGERQRAWRRRPEKLAGFGFCTAVTPVTAAIYGRIADAVYAKPYQLGWGTDPARFLDRETDILAAQREAAAPLPFLYIPERFARRGRHLAPAELEVLQWSALAAGAKGLRWHFGMNKGGLDATPGLIPVLQRAGEQIRRLEPLLAPLVPVADETQGDEKSGYVRVLTAWCGSRGVLYLVRDRDLGAIPGDMPVRKDVRVELDVPPWCCGASVLDLLGGERLAVSRPGRLPLTLAGLSGFRLLWIDADPGHSVLDTLARLEGDR